MVDVAEATRKHPLHMKITLKGAWRGAWRVRLAVLLFRACCWITTRVIGVGIKVDVTGED